MWEESSPSFVVVLHGFARAIGVATPPATGAVLKWVGSLVFENPKYTVFSVGGPTADRRVEPAARFGSDLICMSQGRTPPVNVAK